MPYRKAAEWSEDMNIAWSQPFNDHIEQQTGINPYVMKKFFSEFHEHCQLGHSEKIKLWEDFEKAILYYSHIGIPLEQALRLLDIKYLGDFYEELSKRWFPLDDAAKLYPLSMERRRMSTYRMSVYFKENVVPELLQMALNFTIKRFPSFATTLKKGFFWHYLDMTKRRFCIEPEIDIPCQPIKVAYSGSQSFRVLYYKNRISIECFHALSDGLSAVNLIISLTAEYLRLTGKEILLDETVLDINSAPNEAEFENAFKKAYAKMPQEREFSPIVNKAAVQMRGKLTPNKPCRIIHLKMNAAELKAVSRKYHTTVARYLMALTFLAGKAAAAESTGNINIQVPVNLRRYYPSKTLFNFVLPCGICLPMEEIDDLQSVIAEINKQMKLKTSKEAMDGALASTERLINWVKYVPLALKRPAAKMGYGFLGDKAYTTILSDLGVIRMPPSVSEHIERMDGMIGASITHRARCVSVTFNNITTLSITKATIDPTFEEKMYELIRSDSIAVEAEGSEIYGN